MTNSLEAWLDRHVREEDSHAHRLLSTAKLVTTFAAATAATFVATGLQVGGKPSGLDWIALIAMLVALALVVVIVCHRRKSEPLVHGIAYPRPNAQPPSDSDGDRMLHGFRTTVRDSAGITKRRADRVFKLMIAQILLCILAMGMAVIDIHLHAT